MVDIEHWALCFGAPQPRAASSITTKRSGERGTAGCGRGARGAFQPTKGGERVTVAGHEEGSDGAVLGTVTGSCGSRSNTFTLFYRFNANLTFSNREWVKKYWSELGI